MAAESETTPAVALFGISKSFAGLKVVKDVDFDVHRGEVHALLGENGAGKSTLIKIIAGVHQPDDGRIDVGGEPRRFATPREARQAGIATVHQELLLFPELTVAENIFLGQTPKAGWGILDWKEMRTRARALLDSLDSHDLDIDARVGSLSVANRQRVEIARALSQDAKVVIMDEPTAALAEADVERLMDIVTRLKSRGVAIVYVSHRMPEIFALADRVTVLRDGAHIATKKVSEVDEAALVTMMVGRAIDQLYPKRIGESGETLLELRNVSYRTGVRDISLKLRAGEILGIAGLVGSGRTELALTIFGITPATAGDIVIEGKAVKINSPEGARDLGIAYVPEDRGLQGLIRMQSIADNIALANLRRPRHRYFRRYPQGIGRGNDGDQEIWDQSARTAADRPRTLGRQSAEGGAGQMAGDQSAHSHHGRADARHRCRRQGRNPSAHAQAHIRRHGHPHDLERTAGSAWHERSRTGDERRAHRRFLRNG